MTAQYIDIKTAGPLAFLTLNRPEKRNAVNEKMIRELHAFFKSPGEGIRAVILTCAGDHFCGGLDLAEHRSRGAAEAIALSEIWYETTNLMQFGSIPVLAVMTGAVIGGGMEIATACHIRISDPSTFYSLPEARRGIFVGGGASVRVPRIIGADRMVEMMLTGRRMGAEEGHRLGLSHYLVPKDEALPLANRLAETILENSPLSNLLVLKGVQRIAGMGFAEGQFAESITTAITQGSQGAMAGIDAFLRKTT